MHFASPYYLWLLTLLVPMIGYYVWRTLQGGAAIQISSVDGVVRAPKTIRYYLRHLPFVLRAAAFALLKSYDDFAAADPACVQRMLSDVAALAPAQHYGIIVGCHGKAWVPADHGALSYSARMTNELEDLWIPMPGALLTRSFGDTGRSIDITNFAAAVKAQNYRPDYLLFDACFMANIETLYSNLC